MLCPQEIASQFPLAHLLSNPHTGFNECIYGAFTSVGQTRRAIPPRIDSSREFIQALMTLQRATNLIASTLDLDALLDRVVHHIADSIGSVKAAVWLRACDTNEIILRGVRGSTTCKKGDRLQIGRQGIVGYVASTGKMHYARDVHEDPYYIACEPNTGSEVGIPLKVAGVMTGVLCIDPHQTDAFSDVQLKVLQALGLAQRVLLLPHRISIGMKRDPPIIGFDI